MHLVGCIIRIHHEARSSECQIGLFYFFITTFARKSIHASKYLRQLSTR